MFKNRSCISIPFIVGGIIEGCPPSDSVTSLSVDVLIEPTGTTKIISAADQVSSFVLLIPNIKQPRS